MATHRLPERIAATPDGDPVDHELAARFPDAGTSRRLRWGILGRLLTRNPGFAGPLGGLHVLLMMAGLVFAGANTEIVRNLTAFPLIVLAVVLVGGAVGLAHADPSEPHPGRRTVAGLIHGVAQLALAAAGIAAFRALQLPDAPALLSWSLAVLAYGPVIALVATELAAVYLLAASSVGVNLNEVFTGQVITDYKSFVRMRFTADGAVTVYPLGVRRTSRRWVPTPAGPAPAQPMPVHLIEEPFTLR
jgi:hypothetical protein